jgi:hypothetical protein
MILLDGDVTVAIGNYAFRADRAVVRIDLENLPGRRVKDLCMYLDNARPRDGTSAVWARAPRLLVTASTTGNVDLAVNLVQDQPAAGDPLVLAAEGRINRYLAALSAPVAELPATAFQPDVQDQARRDANHLALAQATAQRQAADQRAALAAMPPIPAPPPLPTTTAPAIQPPLPLEEGRGEGRPTTAPAPPPAFAADTAIMARAGVLRYHADKILYDAGAKGDKEKVAVLMGHASFSYQSDDHRQLLDIKAENAVIFLTGADSPVSGNEVSATKVQGIYLEDNAVVSNGNYTVRAPRVYFDLARNKALLLEAVFYTYDETIGVSAYVRATRIREVARDAWVARHAILTTSEFAEPQFSVAADTLTMTQNPPPGGGKPVTHITAGNNVFYAGDVPVGYWPYMAGDAEKTAMQSLSFDVNSTAGAETHSTWDLFTLAGQTAPQGVSLIGQADLEGRHGGAVGTDLTYTKPQMTGSFTSYYLPNDDFLDRLGGRNDVKFDDATRGFFSWEHRQYLPDNWQVSLEVNKVSDPTFLEAFYPQRADDAKPDETSFYAKKQEDDWAFTFLSSYDINTFVPQSTVLQSPGYTVDKLPELGFYNVGDSFWHDRLTYYGENRLSRMRIRSGSDTPALSGFTEAQSQQLFDMPADTSFDQRLAAEGLPSDYRLRLDSRHEVDAPLKASIFDITPYIAGRATAYDQDETINGADNTNFRGWGSLGTRFHTQFTGTDDSAEIPLLDVHRLRHIVEPAVDVFLAGSTFNSNNLPLYDSDVEGISDGSGARLGLKNTWQTQRGGPARWRSVDWIVLDTDLIYHSGPSRAPQPLDRYIDYRPEYSLGGDQFHTRLLWMVSDALSAAAECTYGLDPDQFQQWRIGLALAVSSRLSFGIDFNDLPTLQTKLFTISTRYAFTDKYAASFSQSLNLTGTASRVLSATVERKIPGWRLLFTGTIDTVNNVRTIGVLLYPGGQNSSHFLTPIHNPWPE